MNGITLGKTTTMNNTTTFNQLIEQAGEYHPIYGNGLATHLPMVLNALNRLNASDDKLKNVFKKTTKKLEYIDSLNNVIAVNSIREHLGDSSKFKQYLKYYNDQLAINSIDLVLKQFLPVLIVGIAASAFHALIRLAYAIEISNKKEVAIALAFWSAEFQSFDLSDQTSNETLENILLRLAPLGVNHIFSPGIIVDRMAEMGTLLKQEKLIIQPEFISLSTIRCFSLSAFNDQDNFTLLHTVTACHAFSVIRPYLDNDEVGLRELWKAILNAYLSTGLGYEQNETVLTKDKFDFSPLINKALISDDDHIIKLIYTCVCEYEHYHDPLYYIIAQRAVLGIGN